MSDVINNRNTNEGKLTHEWEDKEEKESDWENYSHDDEQNDQNELLTNEPHQSVLSECKSLEENVGRLGVTHDEISCFGTMHQCHLALTRN